MMFPKAANDLGRLHGRQASRGSPSLRQWARLFRAASRVPGLDVPQLRTLAQRLYQKPLEALSMLEAADLIGTLKAVESGLLDLKLAAVEFCDG